MMASRWRRRCRITSSIPYESLGDSLKYILATVSGRIFPWRKPTKEQIGQIHRELIGYAYSHCPTGEELEADIAGIEKLWSELEKKLSDNAGLVQYMNDWGSCSRSFAQFPATLVPRAIALESAFGTNYDNAGRYHKLLPGCISTRCAAVEPEFVELRRRAHFANATIRQLIPELEQYVVTPRPKKKVGSSGHSGCGTAGRVAEVWLYVGADSESGYCRLRYGRVFVGRT